MQISRACQLYCNTSLFNASHRRGICKQYIFIEEPESESEIACHYAINKNDTIYIYIHENK